MFSKSTIELPPCIDKWVMEMQNVYEPGKDAADPLDFLSGHTLPETDTDRTKKEVKAVINNEYAVVLKRLQDETSSDTQLQNLKDQIIKVDWER